MLPSGTRTGPDDGPHGDIVDIRLRDGAGRAEQRTAVLPVRHGHATSGLLLSVHELRDDERLFVVRSTPGALPGMGATAQGRAIG